MQGLVFGAGNIGRGFLGLLLSKSGFNVTFIDVDEVKTAAINRERAYPVFVVSEHGIHEEAVQHIRAVHARDSERIVQEIVNADVILTAVGKNALPYLASNLAQGLLKRMRERPHAEMHVAVIACENVQDNTSHLLNLIRKAAPEEMRDKLGASVSFPNCVVDRIVPNTLPTQTDSPLAVAVEEYFQLTLDGSALKGPLPHIKGVGISGNLSAVLEQKLCTLNMAHAIVGYFGYLRNYAYVHEAMRDSAITDLLHGAMQEVSFMLTKRHGCIQKDEQDLYVQKITSRFKNPHLRDEITRVAREPKRKLGPDDRLIKPATLAHAQGMTPAYLASGITAALHYTYDADAEAQILVKNIREQGIDTVLEQVSGLARGSDISRLVKSDFLLRGL